jgi:hypothetical protein
MKRTLPALILAVLSCLPLFSQNIYDPDDKIYRHLTVWFEKGYFDSLPMIRPYPIQIIVPMLKAVREKGGVMEVEIADRYLKELNGETEKTKETEFRTDDMLPRVHAGLRQDLMVNGGDFYSATTLFGTGNGYVTNWFSYSGQLYLSLINPPETGFFPLYTQFMDESKSGGGTLGSSFTFGQLGQFGLFLGTDFLYLQAGLMRTAFGPNFRNSPVVSPDCPAAGHISLTCDLGWIGFSSLFMDLLASEYVEPLDGKMYEYPVAGALPVLKYLVSHTVHVRPFDFVEFGVIQTVLAGEVFHWFYVMPFPLQNLFYSQQLAGDRDSSYIGLYARFKFPLGIGLNATMYIDDWDAFSTVSQAKGILVNFDSAQNKFALQASLSWAAGLPVLQRMDLEYLMITPYTYTHSRFYKENWTMYTHAGRKIGPDMEPNSDQILYEVDLQPLSWLGVHATRQCVRGIRHGQLPGGRNDLR